MGKEICNECGERVTENSIRFINRVLHHAALLKYTII